MTCRVCLLPRTSLEKCEHCSSSIEATDETITVTLDAYEAIQLSVCAAEHAARLFREGKYPADHVLALRNTIDKMRQLAPQYDWTLGDFHKRLSKKFPNASIPKDDIL